MHIIRGLCDPMQRSLRPFQSIYYLIEMALVCHILFTQINPQSSAIWGRCLAKLFVLSGLKLQITGHSDGFLFSSYGKTD